ncbi:hypothetical protein FVE85_1170 [Porphyridium purpureum]|uniref:Uncharacterized protein n=1 Tax=Porphyridium purpureum TaxID=35688 RepID=A0A5J4Z0N5_PORPP|nr:hypothetical protein FVE85_1170 [Porphyridium purpureum]|eukprot:POR6195..scf208_2
MIMLGTADDFALQATGPHGSNSASISSLDFGDGMKPVSDLTTMDAKPPSVSSATYILDTRLCGNATIRRAGIGNGEMGNSTDNAGGGFPGALSMAVVPQHS